MSKAEIWLAVFLVTFWSVMFYQFGARVTEGWLQTGAVERGYAEWVLPEHPYRWKIFVNRPGWRWIEPEE